MKVIGGTCTRLRLMGVLQGMLIALVILDGLISNFIVRRGLGREGNPLLQDLVGSERFIVIKILGALLCALILWDVYRRWPKLAIRSSVCFVLIYGGIVLWNLSIFWTGRW